MVRSVLRSGTYFIKILVFEAIFTCYMKVINSILAVGTAVGELLSDEVRLEK